MNFKQNDLNKLVKHITLDNDESFKIKLKDKKFVKELCLYSGYRAIREAFCEVSKFNGRYCVSFRVVLTQPKNKDLDNEKSYNIYKTCVKESYLLKSLSSFTDISAVWYKMKKENVKDEKLLKICYNLYNPLYNELLKVIYPPVDFLDDD